MIRPLRSWAVAGLLAFGSLLIEAGAGAAATPIALPPAAASTATDTAPTAVTLKLGVVAPPSLDADHDLVVKGSLRNPGPAISGATLRLRLNSSNLNTRAKIDAWMSDDNDSAGVTGGSGRPLPGGDPLKTIPAGTTIPFTLTVPAGETGLRTADWAFGPRGLTVQLSTGADELASLRTLVVWAPPGSGTTTRFSLLVPITSSSPSDDAGAATEASAALLGRGGRLQRVLDATSSTAFDWAIDPAVLQATSRLTTAGVVPTTTGAQPSPTGPLPGATTTGTTGTNGASGTSGTSGTSGASTSAMTGNGGQAGSPQDQQAGDARSWLAKFKEGLGERVVMSLPYGDTDLNSVLDNGQAALLRTADQLGKGVVRDVVGGRLDRTVAWPGDGVVSGKSVAGLSRADRTDVIIAASSQPPTKDLGYTPTGRSTMQSKGHQLNGLLYDDQLSGLLAGSGGANSVVSSQWMLAELAAIGMERPGVTTHVLAVAPRNWNPDPPRVQALASALASAPWVSLSDVDRLRQQQADATPRTEPQFDEAAQAAELPLGPITAATRMNDGLNVFVPIVVDAGPEMNELRERVASLLSQSWRGLDAQLSVARQRTFKSVNPVVTGVYLWKSSNPLFLAKQSNLSVYVQNDTAFTVRVKVKLTPRSGQLSFEGPKEVQITPNTRTLVLIETKALAGGNVNVDGRLLTPAGEQLGPISTFQVRVRPGWERAGMIGAGSILGVLFVIGLLRSIRRGRTRVPPESVPDVDDLADQGMPERGAVPPAPTLATPKAEPEAPEREHAHASASEKKK